MFGLEGSTNQLSHLPCCLLCEQMNSVFRTRTEHLVIRALLLAGMQQRIAAAEPLYDMILRQGAIYDGSGGAPITGDLAIKGEAIAAVGDLSKARGAREIQVKGLAV